MESPTPCVQTPTPLPVLLCLTLALDTHSTLKPFSTLPAPSWDPFCLVAPLPEDTLLVPCLILFCASFRSLLNVPFSKEPPWPLELVRRCHCVLHSSQHRHGNNCRVNQAITNYAPPHQMPISLRPGLYLSWSPPHAQHQQSAWDILEDL